MDNKQAWNSSPAFIPLPAGKLISVSTDLGPVDSPGGNTACDLSTNLASIRSHEVITTANLSSLYSVMPLTFTMKENLSPVVDPVALFCVC